MIAAVTALTLTLTMSATSFAANRVINDPTISGYNIYTERDQVTPENGTYAQYQDRFNAKGLTFKNVKTLQNRGYNFTEILNLSDAEISEIIPSFGLRIVLRSAPSNYVRVSNVAGSVEYFHPDTGYVPGDFYRDNNGDSVERGADGFARKVYGRTGGIRRMYYTWGEWDDTYQTHQGHDFSGGSSIKSAHEGEVITLGSNGRIGIYDSEADVTYFYAHMGSRAVKFGDIVSIGDLLGTEGDHLHFEVREGRVETMGPEDQGLHTFNPYDYM